MLITTKKLERDRKRQKEIYVDRQKQIQNTNPPRETPTAIRGALGYVALIWFTTNSRSSVLAALYVLGV